MGNMNDLCKLLRTHCLNSLMDFALCMIICISLLWIFNLNMESVNWSMPHHSQVVWISHFTGDLDLSNNKLTCTLPTEMGNLTRFGKFLCSHCLNYLMNFAFCMIICISLLWIYDLKMESVKWLISHHSQILWLSYFIGLLNLEGNQLLLSADWNGIFIWSK